MQMRLSPRIIADSNILSGKPVIEGTTTPASALIVAVASGVSDEDVRAALEYGAERASEEIVLNDPLFSVAGIFASDEPGWVNCHDALLAEEHGDAHADEQ